MNQNITPTPAQIDAAVRILLEVLARQKAEAKRE